MERVRFLFSGLTILLISAFGNNSIGTPAEPPARIVEFSLFEENGKVGLKDADGEVLIPANYEAIGWSNGKLSIVDKVVGYQSNGLWGLIHTSNRIVTPAEFMELRPGEGSFLVAQKISSLSRRPSFGIINTSGKIIIPFTYDGLQLSNLRAIVMARTGTRYQFGLIDLSHRMLIPIEYQRIYSLGSLRYAVENFENKTAIFSDEGSRVTDFNIDSISSFKKDYAVLYQGQKQGLIDRNGVVILRPDYGEVRLEDDGGIRMRATDTWHFLHGDNKLIRQHHGDALWSLTKDRYLISAGGKVRLADNELNPLHETFFSSVSAFKDGRALFRISSKTGVLSIDGNIIIPAMYHDLEIDQGGVRACVDIGGKRRWVILDPNGKQLSEKNYELIAPFNGTFYPVKNRGFWGAVDAGGREIITCVHDSLIQHRDNNVVVRFKGECGIINLGEHWRVTPQPHPLKLVNDETYFEYQDKTTFLKSYGGGIIYFSENVLDYEEGHIREQLASGAYWIIDMSGTIIHRSNQPQLAEQIFPESEGLRAILKDGKFGFIDDAGRLRIANRYEEARAFKSGLAAIRIRGKWGFIDHSETLVVQPVYDEVRDFDNGVAIVNADGLYGTIDATGKIVLPTRYAKITLNDYGRFELQQGKTYGLANTSGAILIQPRYDALADTGSGYVIVQREGKFGVVTLGGVNTIPMVYDGMTYDSHRDQFIGVKRSQWETFRAPGNRP